MHWSAAISPAAHRSAVRGVANPHRDGEDPRDRKTRRHRSRSARHEESGHAASPAKPWREPLRFANNRALGETTQRDTAAAIEAHVADRHPYPTLDRVDAPEGKSRPDEERADVRRLARNGHARIVSILRHIGEVESDVARLPREDAGLVTVSYTHL